VFNHRVIHERLNIHDLPKTIVNSTTNRFKQIETITRVLSVNTSPVLAPNATRDVDFTLLGDGTSLEVRKAVAAPFDEQSASTEIPDLIPDIFKASLPSHTREFVESGTSITDPPVLATGDFLEAKRKLSLLADTHTWSRRYIYPQKC